MQLFTRKLAPVLFRITSSQKLATTFGHDAKHDLTALQMSWSWSETHFKE